MKLYDIDKIDFALIAYLLKYIEYGKVYWKYSKSFDGIHLMMNEDKFIESKSDPKHVLYREKYKFAVVFASKDEFKLLTTETLLFLLSKYSIRGNFYGKEEKNQKKRRRKTSKGSSSSSKREKQKTSLRRRS